MLDAAQIEFDEDSKTIPDGISLLKMQALMEHEEAVRKACELRGEVAELTAEIEGERDEHNRLVRKVDQSVGLLTGAQTKLNRGQVVSAFEDIDTVIDELTDCGATPVDKVVCDIEDFIPTKRVVLVG